MQTIRLWRARVRLAQLRVITRRTQHLSWTPRLIKSLLDELNVDELFEDLIGPLRGLPKRQYPQAVALAIALRHSWRPDDLAYIVNRLGIAPSRKRRAQAKP